VKRKEEKGTLIWFAFLERDSQKTKEKKMPRQEPKTLRRGRVVKRSERKKKKTNQLLREKGASRGF